MAKDRTPPLSSTDAIRGIEGKFSGVNFIWKGFKYLFVVGGGKDCPNRQIVRPNGIADRFGCE